MSRNFVANSLRVKRRSACTSATNTAPGAVDFAANSCPPNPIIRSLEKTSTGSARSGNLPWRNERFGATHSKAPLRSNRSRPRLFGDRQFGALATFPQSKIPTCRSSLPDGGISPNAFFDHIDIALQIEAITCNLPFRRFGRAHFTQTKTTQNLVNGFGFERNPNYAIAFFATQ